MDDNEKRKERDDKVMDQMAQIVQRLHDFANGKVILMIGELPVRFDPPAE